MKIRCFSTIITLVFVMMAAVSCTGAPPSQGDEPAQEVSDAELSPQPEPPAEPVPAEPIPVEIPEEAPAAADAPVDIMVIEQEEQEEPELAEPVLAEADVEEMPPTEIEPEPPELAVAPEPDPPEETIPPPVSPAPEPEPPQVAAAPPPASPPPVVEPPPVIPPPAEPPPVPPASPAPEPVPQPPVEEEEPPAIAREPLPRIIPELPNPTPAIRGRQDDEIVFSRVVRATVGQLVVVPFRGTGWVYLGETGARRGIFYDSRRLDPEGQSFIFRTESAGEYALKFYRQDFIHDFILNDYVQVIVGAPSETAATGWFGPSIDRGRVIAEPRWPTSLAEAQALRADTRPDPAALSAASPAAAESAVDTPLPATPAQPPAQTPTATPPAQTPQTTPPTQTPQTAPPAQTPPPSPPATPADADTRPSDALPPASPDSPPRVSELPPDLDLETYLHKAQEEFDAGRVASAISLLDQLRGYYPVESDEILWLYGQFYEANSPSRNILAALDCYRRLTQEYPQSSRYNDARRRIAYLQRYYINIQ